MHGNVMFLLEFSSKARLIQVKINKRRFCWQVETDSKNVRLNCSIVFVILTNQFKTVGSIVSCPDPTSHEEKSLATIVRFLGCSSIDLEWTLITYLDDIGPISLTYVHAWKTRHYSIGLSKIKAIDSAQPKNCSNHQTLSLWEVGSGHETVGYGNG